MFLRCFLKFAKVQPVVSYKKTCHIKRKCRVWHYCYCWSL